MAEEEKKETEKTEETAAEQPAKSSIVKYIIMGLVGALVVGGVAFGTMMILGGGKSEVAEDSHDTEAVESSSHEKSEATDDEDDAHLSKNNSHDTEESSFDFGEAFEIEEPLTEAELLAEYEKSGSAIDNIKEQLEFLDFDPETGDMGDGFAQMSVEDSLEQVSWLVTEKKRLEELQAKLDKRAKTQQKLEKKLNKQILRIEQAESSRISTLARLYDGMEPRSVAKLVANLDDNTVVSIIPRMKLKNASLMLGMMPPKRAARLSKKLITISDE